MRKRSTRAIAIIAIYPVGFLIGTSTHVLGLMRRRLLSTSESAPLLVNAYWDLLTLLDPLTVILLWTRTNVGVKLAVLIMATDININTYAYVQGYFGEVVAGMVPVSLLLQSLFGVFVFTTFSLVTKDVMH